MILLTKIGDSGRQSDLRGNQFCFEHIEFEEHTGETSIKFWRAIGSTSVEFSRLPSREAGAGGVCWGILCLEVVVETKGQLQPTDQIERTIYFCINCLDFASWLTKLKILTL